MPKSNRQNPVVLEDLLRIKRAEKPTEAFWQEWEGRYKERRRQAMLEPRPWIKETAARLSIAMARWYLPMGAAAVVAMTFFAVREYNPTVPHQGFSGSVAALDSSTAVAPVATPSGDVLGELRQAALTNGAASVEQERQPGALSDVLSGVDRSADLSPTERAIAANLAAMHALEPELARSWRGRSFVVPNVGSGNALDEEPLASVAASRDLRRSRILGYDFQPVNGTDTPAYSRQQERSISRLAEDQFYESKARSLGARGDRVLVRF